MPTCRTCNKQWPEGTNVCPDDGSSLTTGFVAAASSQGSAATALAVAASPPAPDEPPPTTDLLPGALIGEYKVDKKIGEGGMGAVYSATHPMIGKRAAIKVISAALGANSDAVGRFIQEAQSVNQIGHPNIVDVFAFGELPDGRNYFVMEYLQGQSLADRVHKGEFPLGEAIEILDQVADALEAAHEKQIVHRDLKPDNVYLASVRGGRTMVKLLDFGIAKMSTPDSAGSGGGIAKTRTGMMMGTPGYLSPEQARGKNVDHRTDIYALGCMTFEIVCGRLPFVADNAMDIVLAHMTAPAPRPSTIWPEIPQPLDDLIVRMLEKEPSARPSLQEVRATFSELVSSGLVTLTNARGIGFGSRMQTPTAGMPRPQLATGTQPAQPRPPTGPPGTSPVPPAETIAPVDATPAKKSKAPLFAALAGVLVLGGAGAFFALKGGAEEPAKTVEQQQVTPPTPTPEPPKPAVEPPKVVETPKTVEKALPATIEVAISVEGAVVSIDDSPVPVVGKTARLKVESDGPHRVVVTAAGHTPFEQSVTTAAGKTETVVATLEKAKAGKTTAGKTTTTAGKTTAGKTTTTAGKTTTTTPAGAGSGSAKKVDVDKDAPVNPF